MPHLDHGERLNRKWPINMAWSAEKSEGSVESKIILKFFSAKEREKRKRKKDYPKVEVCVPLRSE